MLTSARDLPDGSDIEADVCIVGGGAAGITLARALRGSGLSTVLLESGGLLYEAETQALYEGTRVGRSYFPLTACRLRWLGGTTNHWAGYARPFDAIDFEARSWVPNSGWPIGLADLEPWYRRAHEVCELGPFVYDAAYWTEASGLQTLALPEDTFVSRVFQRSPPTRFGSAYRQDLEGAQDLQVILHANATQIEVDSGGDRVRAVRVRTLAGSEMRVEASRFVLAAGGIENARILLHSTSPAHARGLGNERDRVGRYFMDHPHLVEGFFRPTDPSLLADFYSTHEVDGGRFEGILALRDEVLREEEMQGVSITLAKVGRRDERALQAETSAGLASLKHLSRRAREGELPEELGDHVWRVLSEIDEVAVAAYGRFLGDEEEGTMYKVFFRTEQAPNPDSRVTLAEDRDALGMRRVALDWQLSESDLHSMRRGHELLGRECGRAGLGRIFFPEDPSRTWLRGIFGGNHHMGTTRMHDDPDFGVTDRNARVHDLENLFIAGSSLFPTCGYANPTLTIVALALRLAEHLKGGEA